MRTIVDGGANIGDETARFLHFHPEATIVAIEAEPSNFALLQENFRDSDRVVVIHGGLWPTEGRLKINRDTYGSMESFSVTESCGSDAVLEAWPITRILQLQGWDHIDVLKLDIEGAEYDLFTREAKAWIDKVSVIIFEVADHERAGSLQAVMRSISHKMFNAFICGENIVLMRHDSDWQLDRVVGFRS